MSVIAKRHPMVVDRRVALSDQLREQQIANGNYTTDRGVRYAFAPTDLFERVPVWDRPPVYLPTQEQVEVLNFGLRRAAPEQWASVQVIVAEQLQELERAFSDYRANRTQVGWRTQRHGVVTDEERTDFQGNVLREITRRLDADIIYRYFQLVVGHDVHVSMRATLRGTHWHRGWADPFTGEHAPAPDPTFETCPWLATTDGGFAEWLGLLSAGLVTDAFVSEIVDELVSATASEFADFDFHEVGTNAAIENNDHTALQTSSGIARATGSPTDSDPVYDNSGTITADATESWEEHGLFNNSTGAAMMDRNQTGGQSVESSDQVQYDYSLTVNPET